MLNELGKMVPMNIDREEKDQLNTFMSILKQLSKKIQFH